MTVTGSTFVVTAAEGPGGGRSGVFVAPIDAGTFARAHGVPEDLGGNVDTNCLAANGSGEVAFGTADGRVFLSDDEGRSFVEADAHLANIRSVAYT